MIKKLKLKYLQMKKKRLLPNCGKMRRYEGTLRSPCMICYREQSKIFFNCKWKTFWAYGSNEIYKQNDGLKIVNNKLEKLSDKRRFGFIWQKCKTCYNSKRYNYCYLGRRNIKLLTRGCKLWFNKKVHKNAKRI